MRYAELMLVAAASDTHLYASLVELAVTAPESPLEEGMVMQMSVSPRLAMRVRHSLS